MHHDGYSLAEILTALFVIAILAALSLPILRELKQAELEVVMQSQLTTLIDLARNEAEARHMPIALCPSDDDQHCSHAQSKSLLVYVDTADTDYIPQPEQRITIVALATQLGTLHWRAYPFYRDRIRFFPTDIPRSDNGTFWYCRDTKQPPRFAILLSQSARSRLVLPDKAGVITDGEKRVLSCAN